MKISPHPSLAVSALALGLAVVVTACQSPAKSRPSDLEALQGTWSGEGAGGACSITINGNSLLYRAGTNWWKTTFRLPPGTHPRQLHATIEESGPPSDAAGTVINAIYTMEAGTFTLATDGSDKPPKTFADANSRYVLTKVRPTGGSVNGRNPG